MAIRLSPNGKCGPTPFWLGGFRMFERMARGWALMKQSWQVLRLDKELMLFPILSAIACLLVMASFALPLVVSPTIRDAIFADARSEQQEQPEALEKANQNSGVRHREE